MLFSIRRMAPLAVLIAATSTGCNALPRMGGDDDDDGPRRWSSAWYEGSDGEIGVQQKHRAGRLWPPYARPTTEQAELSHRFHAAHYWPYPYNCQDRAYVHEVTQRQINNGWMTQTTLMDYHFDEQNTLNKAGRMHLRWILQHAPPEHRATWVQTADTNELSQQRLASVQVAANEMVGPENVPAIVLRSTVTGGRPALEIDAIRRAEIGSIQSPRIMYESTSAPSG